MSIKDKPENFTPKFEVVSCFVEYKNEILLLLRQDHKPQGNTWWVPAGKVDAGETIYEAMQREWKQETKLDLWDATYIDTLFVRYPEYDFVYHMFSKKFEEKPPVEIHIQEHKKHIREDRKKALNMDLIQGLDECIKMTYPDTN